MPRQHTDEEGRPHIPVLLTEALEYLGPKKNDSYLDVTAGYGGHAKEVLKHTDNPEGATLVDRDEMAVKTLQENFGHKGARIIHKDYLAASQALAQEGKKFDMILADLGVSSPHLNMPDRGFTFAESGPLDMRMDQRQALTAGDLVNNARVEELADILKRYGEEPKAHSIAQRITENRPITTTTQLATIISQAIGWRGRRSRIHPATRSFQALRIAVNDELSQLEKSLPIWVSLLAPGGRLVIISFHSLEDRITKKFFAEHAAFAYDAELEALTRKPVTPSPTEIVSNPRARSAKLRASRKK
ncbi:MAG: 16S rRNA (cytosine(1402)-N(4))-methyltransferase RsmH [Candidatus Saccharimonadales bacterium]